MKCYFDILLSGNDNLVTLFLFYKRCISKLDMGKNKCKALKINHKNPIITTLVLEKWHWQHFCRGRSCRAL